MGENILVRLKYILNSYKDEELKKLDLWIDNKNNIEVIAVDNNAITLVTNTELLKINNIKW